MSQPVFHWSTEQNSAEWFALRMAIPTASAFDKIVTPEGKRSSQAGVYMSKLLWEFVSGYPMQEDEDAYQSTFMEHGHEQEPFTVAKFEFVTDLKADKCGFVSNWDGMIGASPDRVVKTIACAEMKSPAPWTQLAYFLDKDSLVKKYKVQLQGQMLVCEFDKQFICSDHPKLKPVILDVGRDDKFIATAQMYLREFVDQMLEKRLILEREFGKRKVVEIRPAITDGIGDLGVSMDDVDAIINAHNK